MTLPLPALAGGFGIVGTGGMHGDRLYYYAPDAQGELVQQEPLDQLNANFGGGLELVLGDRDKKILGVFRGYYLQDTPQRVEDEMTGTVYNIRTAPRDIGMITGGLQWGLYGDPTGFQLILTSTIGTGFFTSDFTEFITGELGGGVSYTLQRRYQLHAEVSGGVRYRKSFYPTFNAYLGIRYLFD
jgi:hypothetical protein